MKANGQSGLPLLSSALLICLRHTHLHEPTILPNHNGFSSMLGILWRKFMS